MSYEKLLFDTISNIREGKLSSIYLIEYLKLSANVLPVVVIIDIHEQRKITAGKSWNDEGADVTKRISHFRSVIF